MTIRARITWLFASVVAVIVLLLSSLVYFFANQNVFNDFYKRLELRARIASKLTLREQDNTSRAFEELRQEYLEKLPAQQEYIIRLNNRMEPDSGMPQNFPAELIKKIKPAETAFARYGKLLYAGIQTTTERATYAVFVSGRNVLGDQFLNNLEVLLLTSFVVKALIIGFVAFLFSRRILKPVSAFTEEAKNIGAHNLHVRIDAGENRDEIAGLANTFNHMLDRLETSFESQKNFIGHASHELRTPLTTIIGEAEWALLKERNLEDYRQSLHIIQKQAERLDEITKSLLVLARTATNSSNQDMSVLRIDEKLINAIQLAESLYPGRNIMLDLSNLPEQEEHLQCIGNRDLLKAAFSNLLINACKYSHDKDVQIDLNSDGKQIEIKIADQGIGIPLQDQPYIFDAFYRSPNTIKYQGYGIGLPLTRNIIKLHNGSIRVHSVEGLGTTVTVTLPCASYHPLQKPLLTS